MGNDYLNKDRKNGGNESVSLENERMDWCEIVMRHLCFMFSLALIIISNYFLYNEYIFHKEPLELDYYETSPPSIINVDNLTHITGNDALDGFPFLSIKLMSDNKNVSKPQEFNEAFKEHSSSQIDRVGYVNLYKITNMFFFTFGIFFNKTHSYYRIKHCDPLVKDAYLAMFINKTYTNVEALESVILITHLFSSVFGHFILDQIPALVSIPESILKNSKISMKADSEVFNDFWDILDIKRDAIISNDYQPYFSKNLYTTNSILCSAVAYQMIQHLRAVLRKNLNLTDIIPTKGYIVGRGRPRSMPNKRELLFLCREKYKELSWSLVFPPHSVREAAMIFNEARLCLSVHGSHNGNSLYMQDYTSVIIIRTNNPVLNFIEMSYASKQRVYYATHQEIYHFSLASFLYNLTVCLSLIDRAIEDMRE